MQCHEPTSDWPFLSNYWVYRDGSPTKMCRIPRVEQWKNRTRPILPDAFMLLAPPMLLRQFKATHTLVPAHKALGKVFCTWPEVGTSLTWMAVGRPPTLTIIIQNLYTFKKAPYGRGLILSFISCHVFCQLEFYQGSHRKKSLWPYAKT